MYAYIMDDIYSGMYGKPITCTRRYRAAYIQTVYESRQQSRTPAGIIIYILYVCNIYGIYLWTLTEHRAISSISEKLRSEDWFEYTTLFDSILVRRFNVEENSRLSVCIKPSKLDFFSSVSIFWGDSDPGDSAAASISLSLDKSCCYMDQ